MKKSNRFNKEKLKEMLPKILKIGGIIFGMGVLFVAGLFIYYAKDLPDPGKVNKRLVAESTKIYDRTGQNILYEIHGEEKRTIISADQIPDTVKFATIVLEDQGFYSHHGIDFRGIARAAFQDVLKRSRAQGGSTITQQFIKNSILTKEKKFSRKIKEVVLAIEIEQKFEKDEILQMYLNEIPYGMNAYGIEAAAQSFFGIHARELSLAQSALLASLPKAPTLFSPHGSNTERLLARWKFALLKMKDLGYIKQEQYDEAVGQDILSQIKPIGYGIKAPHFVLYVKEQLVAEFGEDEIEKGGFKVITTLDWDLQQIAEKAVKEGVEKNGAKYNFSNAALTAINPRNGHILSMVGSKDYFDETIDGNVNVAMRLRQPGSSFKPYVYAQAFDEGYSPETIIFDVDTDFETDSGKSYNPKNYDGGNRGPVKMKEALATSLNVPAVKTLYLAGVKDSIKLASSMGISTLTNPDRYGLALVLGGGEVRLLDHTSAFSVFANEGERHEKTAILKIEDAGGSILKSYEETKGEKVLDRNVALEICQILSDNSLRAPVFGSTSALHIPGKNVMGKTGTTNEWRDGWLIGSSRSLTAGVWTGNNDNTAMARGADGSYTAGPIWNQFMVSALANMQVEEFEKPEKREKTGKAILDGDLEIREELEVCKYEKGEYCIANSDCPDSLKEKKKYFVAHNILWYLDKNDPKGDYPKDPQKDSQFKNWEKAVQKWGEKEYDKKYEEMPEKECSSSDFEGHFGKISIASPFDGGVITERNINIITDISGKAEPKQVDFFVDGTAVGNKTSGSFDLSYTVPEDKNDRLVEIEVKLYDKDGGSDSDKISVRFQFPAQ